MPDATDAAQAATNDAAQAATTGGESQADTAETISLDEARKLRSESANLRKRLKDAETKNATFESEKLTETEKTQQRLSIAEQRAADLERENRAFKAHGILQKAGALDPELLADRLPDDALGGDDKAVQAAIAKLRTQYPSQFRTNGGADGGAGRQQGTASDMNRMIRQAAGRE